MGRNKGKRRESQGEEMSIFEQYIADQRRERKAQQQCYICGKTNHSPQICFHNPQNPRSHLFNGNSSRQIQNRAREVQSYQREPQWPRTPTPSSRQGAKWQQARRHNGSPDILPFEDHSPRPRAQNHARNHQSQAQNYVFPPQAQNPFYQRQAEHYVYNAQAQNDAHLPQTQPEQQQRRRYKLRVRKLVALAMDSDGNCIYQQPLKIVQNPDARQADGSDQSAEERRQDHFFIDAEKDVLMCTCLEVNSDWCVHKCASNLWAQQEPKRMEISEWDTTIIERTMTANHCHIPAKLDQFVSFIFK